MSSPGTPRPITPLDPAGFAADPIAQFQSWYAAAEAAGLRQPEAMALATATPDGRPSVRMVLLKGVDARGFRFFTNLGSRKGRELAANPRAALAFHWEALGRQVRIEGDVAQLSAAESDAYFASRPEGSRFAATASPQSEAIASRAELEARVAALRAQHPSGDLPRPAGWGGFVVAPGAIEFWQQRENRLHDRLLYRRDTCGWTIDRLAP